MKIKKYTPRVVRAKLSELLDRPAIERLVLRDYQFVRDGTSTPRITLIMPGLSKSRAFGGLSTAVQLFLSLASSLTKKLPVDVRILSENRIDANDSLVVSVARSLGYHVDQIEVTSLVETAWKIGTRPNEVFFVYSWWISRNLDPVLEAQEKEFGTKRNPKIHILQEYEPFFYPYSSAHMLAREAIDGRTFPLWIVANTRELLSYYNRQGHSAERQYLFEPRLNSDLRESRKLLSAESKKKTIIIYGRPRIPRNCFSIIESGLRYWAKNTTADTQWRLVSAGIAHQNILLGADRKLISIGKLSLPEYGALLREASIGISLMASPHPSYPPLEMAHFGIHTITNSYDCKDPSLRHDNLRALPDMRPETIACELDRAILQFTADPGFALRRNSRMPEFLSDGDFECVDELSSDLAALLSSVAKIG